MEIKRLKRTFGGVCFDLEYEISSKQNFGYCFVKISGGDKTIKYDFKLISLSILTDDYVMNDVLHETIYRINFNAKFPTYKTYQEFVFDRDYPPQISDDALKKDYFNMSELSAQLNEVLDKDWVDGVLTSSILSSETYIY
jgi:hypothetical protein